MSRILSFCTAAALAVTPVIAHAGEAEDMTAAARTAFASYLGEGDEDPVADWDRPVFSAETTGLIAAWKKGLSDGEVEDLNGGGWFCDCQDFDSDSFKLGLTPRFQTGQASAVVDAKVDLGLGSPVRDMQLAMVKEGGGWKIDDLTYDTMPTGVKAALRTAIAEHRKAGRP